MKKIIYALVFSLVISMISFASGTKVSATSLNELSETNSDFSESIEINGVHYFYEDTTNYTLTITKAPNGEEIIAYKDKLKGNEDEFYYQHTLGTSEKINLNQTEDVYHLYVDYVYNLNAI